MPLRMRHKIDGAIGGYFREAFQGIGFEPDGSREILVLEHRIMDMLDDGVGGASQAAAGSKLVSAMRNTPRNVLFMSAAVRPGAPR